MKKKSHIERMFEEGEPIDRAMQAAAEAARKEHARMGVKAPGWKDGKIYWVSPLKRRRKPKAK